MDEVDGVRVSVDEEVVRCDFSFSIKKDHLVNETTVVGQIGKDAIMTFIDPGIGKNRLLAKLSAPITNF